MATLEDFADQVRAAVRDGDWSLYWSLVEQLRESNPAAARELAQAAAHGLPEEDRIPDAFDPRAECGARLKAVQAIGQAPHTHVCRLDAGHDYQAGAGVLAFHHCGCTARW